MKKKAALCLLRMYRKTPESLPVGDWAKSIIPLMSDADLGVASSVVTLVTAFAGQYPQEYAGCVPKAIERLDQVLPDFSPAHSKYFSNHFFFSLA